MTTAEAADQLGILPRSVVQLIRRGLIRAEKRGRDYWIEEAEITRYAVERRAPHRPKQEHGMTDDQLIGLIEQRGVEWAVATIRDAGVTPAIQDGIDLTNWHCQATTGAVIFYQVEHRGKPTGMRAGLGAHGDPDSGWFTTDAPRVAWINDAPSPTWDEVEQTTGEPGVKVTYLYKDGTRHVKT